MLKARVEKLRSGGLETEMAEARKTADELQLVYPEPKRGTKIPARIRQDGATTANEARDPLRDAKAGVLEALNIILSQLNSRIDTEGLQRAARREETLL